MAAGPSEPKTWTKGRFPRTRDEAKQAANDIELHCMAQGCTCRDLKIDFVQPPTGRGFVHVEHHRGCPLADVS